MEIYYSFVINLDDTDTDELSGGVESEFEEEENAATGNSWSFEGVSTIINEGRERRLFISDTDIRKNRKRIGRTNLKEEQDQDNILNHGRDSSVEASEDRCDALLPVSLDGESPDTGALNIG
ncbi:hypothetical protein ANN_13522 [Periplaneta americana]|uniref:Uncharacterized protein n=1 Tax=Periplaneta americana TaxID=6978 RepID=A0ABQ8TLQ5_PERAM|nr:hypothetical protein ANN_13522 [Periplaneta americana]